MNGRIARFCRFGAGLLAVLSLAVIMSGQEQSPARRAGLVTDWTSHHLVFSAPSSPALAVQVAQDPRYWQQWARRNLHPVTPTAGPESDGAAADAAFADAKNAKKKTGMEKDWSVEIGTAAGLGDLNFPAKFSFSTTVASCSDYVVYNTGVAGGSGAASIIAYKNIYATTCSGVPTVAWAYNTVGTVGTSPTISLDGTQVAFVQNTAANAAQLVILKPSLTSGGTFSSPAAITTAANAAAYRNTCAAPCMFAITFAKDGTNSTLPSDGLAAQGSTSSVWVDYAFDVVYVGDDEGYVHKFTGVFTGNPAEVTSGSVTWPIGITGATTTDNANDSPLTSPIYDGSRGVLYVGDFAKRVDWVNVSSGTISGLAAGGVRSSAAIGAGTQDTYDAPLVDPSAGTLGELYQMEADDGTSNCEFGLAGCSGVFQFAGEFAAGAAGTEEATGYDGAGHLSYTGSFDNAYYSGPTAGHLYVCGGGTNNQVQTLYVISFSSTAHTGMSGVATGPAVTTASATCSSITEAYNGTHDFIYTSVTNRGSASGCTGGKGCVVAFNTDSVLTGSSTAAGSAYFPGGSSGIIIDNFSSATGASQIYFSPLGGGTGAASCGATTSIGCAVQAAQGAGL